MIEVTGNLWTYGSPDARCITTNGFVKANGECVMGRGCAREARDRYPDLAGRIGNFIKRFGNHVGVFHVKETWMLLTVPVKPERGADGKPGWACEADLALIERSARELVRCAAGMEEIVLPRPGSGNGRLKYSEVRDVIGPILDDRFVVIGFEGEDD